MRSVEQYRDAISSILEETQRLNHTIDSLLLLARAEAGNSSSTSENIALAPLVVEVANMLSVLAEDNEIFLIQEEQGSPTVYGDRSLLRVALINVVHNAIKFSPRGGTVQITVTIDQKVASVAVADQGPGLREDEFDAVFERFYRGRINSPNDGNGLGLPIVKLIVERFGGTVNFDRTARSGASVVLRLPATFRGDLPGFTSGHVLALIWG